MVTLNDLYIKNIQKEAIKAIFKGLVLKLLFNIIKPSETNTMEQSSMEFIDQKMTP